MVLYSKKGHLRTPEQVLYRASKVPGFLSAMRRTIAKQQGKRAANSMKPRFKTLTMVILVLKTVLVKKCGLPESALKLHVPVNSKSGGLLNCEK